MRVGKSSNQSEMSEMKKRVFNIVLVSCIELMFSCSSTESAANDFSKAPDYCTAQAAKTANSLNNTSTFPRSNQLKNDSQKL